MNPTRVLLIVFAALTLVASACGDDDTAEPTTTTTSPTDDPGPTTTEAGPTTTDASSDPEPVESVADLSEADIALTPVAELERPTALATRAGSPDLYVGERGGRVVVVERSPDGPGTVTDTLVDISDDTTTDGERGLLGLDFDPDGERLYLSYTDLSGHTRVDEWTMDGDAIDGSSRRAVYTLEQPFANHNGGHIGFGPDGFLYLGLGDGGGGGDPLDAGQDPTTPLGSLIRIDPTPDGDQPFTVPPDNPFVDGGGAPEVWSTGLRNPWRFSWDRATDDLWIADVGQSAIEEVNVLFASDDGSPPGRAANLGWSVFEGTEPFDDGPEPENYVPPLHTYSHGPGCSITGGYVSRGDALPGLGGVYLYSDFCDPRIHLVLQDEGEVVETRSLDVSVPGGQAVSFGEGPDGELYVMSLAGGLFRIDPA
ncbi:MAG: PQQ-dependent sugar dehydrogenase [Acidimicrobiales bacterium]